MWVALTRDMLDPPVRLEVRSPFRFDRVQLALRLALAIGLAWIGITGGWLACALYVALPVIAAIAISSRGAAQFHAELAPRLWRVLRWLLQLSGYMMLLVDRFPTGDDDVVTLELRCTGQPTLGSALGRLVTSIPSAVVVMVLGVASGCVWLTAAVIVLIGGDMPPGILAFQRGVLRWQVRLVAYHASLVEDYPPFSLDTDIDDDPHDASLGASGVSS